MKEKRREESGVAERGVEFPDARGILTCLWPISLMRAFSLFLCLCVLGLIYFL